MSNLTLRLLSAAVGIPLLLFCAAKGELWLIALIGVLQSLLLREWAVFARAAAVPLSLPALVIAVVGVDLFIIGDGKSISIAVMLIAVYVWVLSVILSKRRMPLQQLGLGALFLIYAVLPLALWLPLQEHSLKSAHGPWGALALLFIATWLCDSAAYFSGRFLGKHKLYPAASPNKTIEGAVGGLIAAALLLPSMRVLGLADPQPWDYAALPIAVGIAGQIGDLIESLMKREANMKDTSHIIPGHGGFLDRFDSLLLSTPLFLAYLYLTQP